MEHFEGVDYSFESNVVNMEFSSEQSIEIVEIFDVKEKRKWMDLFVKNYSGVKIRLNKDMFGAYCRFFVAKQHGNSLGYIRITNKTDAYKKYCDQAVWCASDAFVKKVYRNQGVLYELINYVVKNCEVKILRAETERLYRCFYYYQSLGFADLFNISDSDLSIAVQKDFLEISNERNSDLS